jgi:beta-galactosidase
MIKGLGMNALSVYVMWNYHEVQPGVFDFQTENKNLPAFLDLAAKYKMVVFIRPGPYVCAEWDFGGMPAWLLQNTTAITVRTNTLEFMTAVKKYFEAIAPIIKKYDSKNGGPIQLLQIENEYGSFGSDLGYINALRQIWKDLGVTTDQYHADPAQGLAKSHWSGGNMGVNNAVSDNDYNIAKKLDLSWMVDALG